MRLKARVVSASSALLGCVLVTALACPSAAGAKQAGAPIIARIAPPAQLGEIPLPPDGGAGRPPEKWDRLLGQRIVRNVSHPTLTPFLPDPAKATGAAVVVIPGGAFMALSLDNEGWNVGRWLADHGVAAFVLKYRTDETPDDEAVFLRAYKATFLAIVKSSGKAGQPADPEATQDVLAALKLVQEGASRWGVDPARTGVLGFSAGAVAALDATSKAPPTHRPAFLGYIYGPMSSVTPPTDAPPLFAALALDDPLFGHQGFGIVEAWRQANRPAECHAYGEGGHGFGMGKTGTTSTLVMDEFYAWLGMTGQLAKR